MSKCQRLSHKPQGHGLGAVCAEPGSERRRPDSGQDGFPASMRFSDQTYTLSNGS